MRYLFLLFFGVVAISMAAQAPATLELPPDARAAGQGNTGLATTPNDASQHWNVAKYAFAPSQGGVSLSYTPWLLNLTDGMQLLYLSGYGTIDEKQAISASLRYFSVGEVISETSTSAITHSPNDFAVDLGYSRRFGDRLSIGLAFRYISAYHTERIDALVLQRANAFAADLGAYYQLPLAKNRLDFGFALNNIGSKLDMGGNHTLFLPMNLGIGTQFQWEISTPHLLRFALDVNKPLVPQDKPDAGVVSGLFSSFADSYNTVTFSGGMEYGFYEKLFVRAGYYYNSPNTGDRSHFTVGAGLDFYRIKLDVSYLIATGSNNSVLNNTFRITLGYTFTKKPAAKTSVNTSIDL